jgi:hypothetical protein
VLYRVGCSPRPSSTDLRPRRWRSPQDDGPSEDEATATNYLHTYKKVFRELPETDAQSHSSDELDSDVAASPPEVRVGKKRGKKGKGGQTKGSTSVRVKSTSTSKSKKPATKKRKIRAVSATTSEDESSTDEALVRSKGKVKRPIKTKPKQEINPATGRPKITALGRLRKEQLVEKVTALQQTNGELLETLEKHKGTINKLETIKSNLEQDKTALEHDKSILAREKSTLSAGFLQLQQTHEALKGHLAVHEGVGQSDTYDDRRTEQEEKSFETGDVSGLGDEMEPEQQQDLGGYDGPMFDAFDDSGYGDDDSIIAASHAAKESSPVLTSQRSTPALADSRAELSIDRHSLQHFLETVDEQEEQLGFNQSYPELMLDSQPQPKRQSPAPSAHRSWASLHHPLSPATSSEGHDDRAQQRLLDLDGGFSSKRTIAFPTPALSSSPVKLGSHTISQRDEEDEGSVAAPTVVAEDCEEESLSIDGRQEQDNKIQRLEREIIDLRTTLGEVELARDLVKHELDIVAR